MTAVRERCDTVILLYSRIIGLPFLVGGHLGDQAGQKPDRLGGLRPGQVIQRLRDWHRTLLRQQTELDRLHGGPPCTVTAVQPAPARRRTAPTPAHTRPAGRPTRRAWPPPRTRLPAARRSMPAGSSACCRRAAPPATPPRHGDATGPTPAPAARPADPSAGRSSPPSPPSPPLTATGRAAATGAVHRVRNQTDA